MKYADVESQDICDDETHDHDGAVTRTAALLADEPTYRAAAELFGAFADPNRLRMLDALRAAGELCVSDLTEVTGMSQSAVSHALKLLRDRRLVDARRDGRHIYYRLTDVHVRNLVEFALEHLAESDE